MASLADLLEDYRNWRGRQEWSIGKDKDVLAGEDPSLVDFVDKFGGIGTDAGGLVGMIKASHGSPHAFTKFLMSKLGTGEGAQAYGHGMYFGEGFDSPVAQKYAETLSNINQNTGYAKAHLNAKNNVARFGDDPEWAAEVIKDTMSQYEPSDMQYKSLADTLEMIQSGKYAKPLESEGNLYNVELKWPDAAREAADPLSHEHLLDWYQPFSEQSKHVKDAVIKSLHGTEADTSKSLSSSVVPEQEGWLNDLFSGASNEFKPEEYYDLYKNLTGESLYNRLINRYGGAKQASEKLMESGLPGIKYQDAGSRYLPFNQGMHNYVMFDENIPNIVSRNGVSLTDLLRR